MTDRRRSAWSALADEWDPDHPAIARMRDVMALRPVEPPEVAPGATPEPIAAPEESSARRRRISELLARLKAGDYSARQLLEDLLK